MIEDFDTSEPSFWAGFLMGVLAALVSFLLIVLISS